MTTDPIFNNFFAHWQALRDGSGVPNRAEIDPRVFPDALENIFIAELTSAGEYRIRLAGMALCHMMAMEVRGQPAASLMQDDQREKMQQIFEQVLTRPAIAELKVEAVDLNDRATPLEMMLLPLRSDLGDVSRIIGCISASKPPVTGPVKLRIMSQKIVPVSTLDDSGDVQGLAETQQAFGTHGPKAVFTNPDAALDTPPKRGHLRLVVDRDQET